jgi:polyisoprenoid-binding protein YceI
MRSTVWLKIVGVVAMATFSLLASADIKSNGPASVKFLAVGPAGLAINGTSSDLTASEKDGTLTIKAKLTNLKTGIGLRDKHLKGYLETEKYPEATLTVQRSALTVPGHNQTAERKSSGKLTLHGVTKPLKFDYQAKRSSSDYLVQGRTQIDIRDFGIEVPCYLGVCVKPDVKISVKFKLREY